MVVDLFSGTGAATKAFKDRGHEVVTVDIAGSPDIRADVRHLPLRNLKPDFVWASPPCQDFSLVSIKAQKRNKAGGWPEAGMETVVAACDAIAELQPAYWAIENVRGAWKWLGRPTKGVGSFYLWGRFPQFDAGKPRKGIHRDRTHPGYQSTYPGPKESARIPYALSLALCCAIERDLQ